MSIDTLEGAELLSIFLDAFPQHRPLLTTLVINLQWSSVRLESQQFSSNGWPLSQVGCLLSTFAFADRRKLAKELNARLRRGEESWTHLSKTLDVAYYSSGPDGTGPLSRTHDVRDASHLLEEIITKLPRLRNLCWHTDLVPMTTNLCNHLGRLETLRSVRLHSQGESEHMNWFTPPLENIFPAGKEYDFVTLDLQIHIPEEFDWERIINARLKELTGFDHGFVVAVRTIRAIAETKTQSLTLAGETLKMLEVLEMQALSLRLPLTRIKFTEENSERKYCRRNGVVMSERFFYRMYDEVVSLWDACSTRAKLKATAVGAKGLPLLSADDLESLDLDENHGANTVLMPTLRENEQLRELLAEGWNRLVAEGRHRERYLKLKSRSFEGLVEESMLLQDRSFLNYVSAGFQSLYCPL